MRTDRLCHVSLYLFAGGTGFALYLILSNALHYLLSVPVFPAAVVSTLLPVPVTFWMQRNLTFHSTRRGGILAYSVLQMGNAAFIGVLSALGGWLQLPAGWTFLVSGGAGAVASYAVQAKFIFPSNERRL